MQILKAADFRAITENWTPVPAPCIDFETNAKQPWEHNARVVCVSITGQVKESTLVQTVQIPIAHEQGENAEPEMMEALHDFIKNWPLGAFWVQSEGPWCLRSFQARAKFVDDPYVALRLRQDLVANLKDAAEKHLNRKMIHIEEVLPLGANYDFGKVHAQDPKGIEYSEQDSEACFDLARLEEKKLAASQMIPVYRVEVAAASMLAEQTLIGYDIDLDVLTSELTNEEKQIERLCEIIIGKLGGQSFPLNSTKTVVRSSMSADRHYWKKRVLVLLQDRLAHGAQTPVNLLVASGFICDTIVIT